MRPEKPKVIHRSDYRPPDYLIDAVDLHFDLDDELTVVAATLSVRRNPLLRGDAPPLVLDGEELELHSLRLDGRALPPSRYHVEADRLTVTAVPERFELETVVAIHPRRNTALSGLYRSGSCLCTQCEAEGFRRITWFVDRPDVMARFAATIVAPRERYPVLLSNGNRVGSGELEGGYHWARWQDPFPKPAYLFALVAGDLRCRAGEFVTASGRPVRLEIWVEPAEEERCEHALRSLRNAMAWDELAFGREYDLDTYMIVAVHDFNMGAMENKGLNVFNSRFVLAAPETATDDDYEHIEGVIGHEYFHNWTGNRITCRDWFQLTLKEGLTVFRDQLFSADMTSGAVKRIHDVRALRTTQFPEDAGPMAHPIRPESYISIDNFYTPTVYEKGAEVVRMYRTLLGADGFRRGMDLYFARHDGRAVTCDDFRAAMADANDLDLEQFGRWYSQAGTPLLEAEGRHDSVSQTWRLRLRQGVPGREEDFQPLHVPVAVGLLGPEGADLPLRLVGEPPGAGPAPTTRVLELREREQEFSFADVAQPPVASLLRGFSAPVRLRMRRGREELAFLMAHDSDPFNRWDAGQALAQELLLELAACAAGGQPLVLDPLLVEAFGRVLGDAHLDGSFRSLAISLPAENVLAQEMEIVDPDALHAAREFAIAELARAHRDALLEIYHSHQAARYSKDKAAVDRRRLKNAALRYLTALGTSDVLGLAAEQLQRADNMTDAQAALALLAEHPGPRREEALAGFYQRWRADPLVVDKWFSVQALSGAPDTPERVTALARHPDFTLANPNRVRALVGAFGSGNQVRFHAPDGSGYALVADHVLALDARNPQLAARMVSPFNQWRRFDAARRALMRAQLQRIADRPELSADVGEIVGRALAPVE
jgi:aminopeptidase N